MAFKCYLVEKYDTTHENAFFRVLVNGLKTKYSHGKENNILIGNVGCNGHVFDGLFISRNKIITLEFKNYGGKLTFSENNPWKIWEKSDFKFVAGGGSIRNPFQQVNAYRHSLIQYLGARKENILDKNHEKCNWGHISGMVIFHQVIELNEKEIPQNIQTYFSIADPTNYISIIDDRGSTELNLTTKEMNQILVALNITDSNLFDISCSDDNVVKISGSDGGKRLELVKNILPKVQITDPIKKILHYYYVLINLERYKEAGVTNTNSIQVAEEIFYSGGLQVNIEKTPVLYAEFVRNKALAHPQNIFVGVNVILEGVPITVLHKIYFLKDLEDSTSLNIDFSDFTLYTKGLEKRGFSNELLLELSSSVAANLTFESKLHSLKELLGEITLSNRIIIGFSEESLFVAQLLRELLDIENNNPIKVNSTLYKYLLRGKFQGPASPVNKLLKITALNERQEEAIRLAFTQPLTVITGPPGTGKTQIILNILANGIILNKKILFASKNNKAVDNVKERMDEILLDKDFFIRFGSKDDIQNKLKPILSTYVTKLQHKSYSNNKITLDAAKKDIDNIFSDKQEYESNLQLDTSLKEEIEKTIVLLESIDNTYESWISIKKKEKLDKFLLLEDEEIAGCKSIITFLLNKLKLKYSGIGKVKFNLFDKKDFYFEVQNSISGFSATIKQIIKKHTPLEEYEIYNRGDDLIKYLVRVFNVLELGGKLREENESKLLERNRIHNLVLELNEKRAKLKERQKVLERCIKKSESILTEKSIKYINEIIAYKLATTSASVVNNYNGVLPLDTRTPRAFDYIDDFLRLFNITAISNLSIRNSIPLKEEVYDMLVFDEASQCDIASAIPLIFRAKTLVVIGDPNQLKHISNVQNYEEDFIAEKIGVVNEIQLKYRDNSLYDYCFDLAVNSNCESVFLDKHYRCHKDIIEYSSRMFYLPTVGQSLEVMTNVSGFKYEPKGLNWFHCSPLLRDNSNINEAEINKAVELAIELYEKYAEASIGITTPFVNQIERIRTKIPNRYYDRIAIDNVHKFQGDEKDIIIFSMVVSKGTKQGKINWINNGAPYLLNVAVSRARSSLIILGDYKFCSSLSPETKIGGLAKYAMDLGRVIE
ncbi:MAG: AAA family ATPase [Melioribacteraceae bacterium]|nr:AAA family ATPase [Melioribacteraceae bacterium]